MNLNRILAASAGLALAAITLSAASLRIRPADCVVVVPTGDAFFEETAQDLAKHFRLVFGVELQAVSPTNLPGGKFPLRLGEPAPGDTKPLASGECRWTATPEGLWFYGSADPAWRHSPRRDRRAVNPPDADRGPGRPEPSIVVSFSRTIRPTQHVPPPVARLIPGLHQHGMT